MSEQPNPARASGTVAGDGRRGHPRRRPVVLFLGLLAFWLLFSGSVGPQQILSGALASGLLTAFWASRMSGHPEARPATGIELPVFALQPRFLLYAGRMVFEIVRANWAVALIVLDPRMPVEPHFVMVKTKLAYNLARVVYANSITLTPGTISVCLEGDTITVHAINRAAAEGVGHWEIENRVKELERRWLR